MHCQTRYQPGDKIGGNFLVYQALLGGMGEVYLCEDLINESLIALKTFQSKYLESLTIYERFKDEVTTWIALENHPNIVRCYAMDFIDSQPFMILEWVACDENWGTDLRCWLSRGHLGLHQALCFTINICNGMIHAGQKKPGLVHRDLKPENILIAQGRIAKITDFGLVKIVQDMSLKITDLIGGPTGRQHLKTLGWVGTPTYMAPEQWLNEELDVRTDIYAVGCILYEMLIGQPPFSTVTIEDLSHQHKKAPIPLLSRRYSLPVTLDKVLAKCLAKQKEERFATFNEFIQALIEVYEHQFSKRPKVFYIGEKLNALELMIRGYTYSKLQRYDNALADFDQSIKLDPEFCVAYINRAEVFANLKRFDEALNDLNRAIGLDPELGLAYTSRGGCYIYLKRYDEALIDLNHAIKIDPSLSLAYANRGSIYFTLNRYKEALLDLNHAIELDSEQPLSYINRGGLYAVRMKFDEALNDLNRVLEKEIYLSSYLSALAYANRGAAYNGMQRYKEALKDLNHSIEIDSQIPLAYAMRGATYAELGNIEIALKDLNYAIMLGPRLALSYIFRGHAFAMMQCYEKSLIDLNHAINLNPNLASAYAIRGGVYLDMQRYNDALIDLNYAVELDPDLIMAYTLRGSVYLNLQRLDKSMSDLNYAIQHAPNYASAYLGRGALYVSMQNPMEALQDFNKADELAPSLPPLMAAQLYINRGAAYIGMGRPDEALTELNLAFELGLNLPHHLTALLYLNRGAAYAQLEKFEEALPDLNQVLSQAPQLPPGHAALAYSNRGFVLLALDRTKEAFSDLKIALEIAPDLSQANLNMGILYGEIGEFRTALYYLEKARQLGSLVPDEFFEEARKELYLEAIKDESALAAFFEFLTVKSLEDMRNAISKYPFIPCSEFIQLANRMTEKQEMKPLKQLFDQQLELLMKFFGG